MNQDQLKQQVADAAIEQVAVHPDDMMVLGIGTGSTAECFIRSLDRIRHRIDTTVSSSECSSENPKEDLKKRLLPATKGSALSAACLERLYE